MQEISGERVGLAVAGTKFLRGAVKRVAYHRMTERSEMHTNLVGSAGVDSQFEQCDLAETGIDSTLHGVMRDGFTATLAAGRHAGSANAIAADAAGNRAPPWLHPAVYERDVGLLYMAAGELFRQLAMGFIVLRDQDQSARGLIEPVNDAGTEFASDGGELAEMM